MLSKQEHPSFLVHSAEEPIVVSIMGSFGAALEFGWEKPSMRGSWMAGSVAGSLGTIKGLCEKLGRDMGADCGVNSFGILVTITSVSLHALQWL